MQEAIRRQGDVPLAPALPAAAAGEETPRAPRLRGLRISTRLLLIILTCLLPTIGLQVGVGWRQWSERRAQLDVLVMHQAQLLGGDLGSIVAGARILLGAASQYTQVGMLGEECGARLAGLLRHAPGFAFLAVVDGDARIACASDPVLAAGRADPAWASAARSQAGFTAGRFARSPQLPGGFLPFYMPIEGGGAGAEATLVAALDLGWLARHLEGLKHAGSPFLENGVLTVADADGVILARHPQHAAFLGQRFPAAALPLLSAPAPGTLRLRSIDGTDRLAGYLPPTPASHGLAAVVGFHETELMADLARALRSSALLVAVASLVAIVLTLLVARRFIARPTRGLLEVARRWREGDLSARAPATDRHSEFGQMAIAFNAMAKAVQRREAELRAHAGVLESRVAERTRALQRTNERLQGEIGERRATEAALLQAQKVQAVGQLAGGIAHDFNNVLQAVLGGVALIRRRAGNAEAVRQIAAMVEDAARRGESVTRRLLAFSRREELRAAPIEVGELLAGLREVLAATLGSRLRVEVEAAPDLPAVLADRGQLETVLVNLATNARDAMPCGGVLTFAAAPAAVGPGDASGLPPGAYVRLEVADTGEGMAPEILARAAEPFFTTKPLGQGTGLGLAMARSFAQGSGGALAIASEPGIGTRISIWLPVPRERAGGEAPAASPGAEAARGTAPAMLRVLLVDDDDQVRDVLACELEDGGIAVHQARSGAAALALLEHGERFDLLVSDLAMPGIDGVTLIREAQRRQPGLPAILVTGYVDDAIALAAEAPAGRGFTLLRKPVDGALLTAEVRRLARHRAAPVAAAL